MRQKMRKKSEKNGVKLCAERGIDYICRRQIHYKPMTRHPLLIIAVFFATVQSAVARPAVTDDASTATETKTYYLRWYGNTSLYMTEEGDGALVVASQDVTQRQFWQLVPTGTTGCFYLRNTATGRYIQSCNKTESSSSTITTGTTAVPYYVWQATSGNVSGYYRLTSTDCANYADTSQSPRALNKDGGSTNVITWYGALTNTGSYWMLEETEDLYDLRPFQLSTAVGSPVQTYTILNYKDDTALTMATDGTLSWEQNDLTDAQTWYFVGTSSRNGGFLIVNVGTGTCINLANATDTRWTVFEGDDSNYYFRPYATKDEDGTSLTVASDSLVTFKAARSKFARSAQVYELPCASVGTRYITRAEINGDGALVPMVYPLPKVSGSSVIKSSATKPSTGYTIYTSDKATLLAGSTADVTIRTSAKLSSADTLLLYADWNRDGVFDAVQGIPATTYSTTVQLPIPADATVGKTRLRVRLTNNALYAADDEATGQVLDFVVNVTNERPEVYTVTACSNDTLRGTAAITSDGESEVTVTATPRGNATFAYWKEGNRIVSAKATYTFTRDHNAVLTAYFTPNTDVTGIATVTADEQSKLDVSVTVADSRTRLDVSANSPVRCFQLYTLDGRLLAQSATASLACPALSQGCYLVRVKAAAGEASLAIVVK